MTTPRPIVAVDGPTLLANEGAESGHEWTTPGTVLGDRFIVEGVLGEGGMGYVLTVRHRDLGERLALKMLLPGRLLSEQARVRLIREARAAARIRSAHVVRVFDAVSSGPGAPYVVMEHLTGETLAQRIDRLGPLGIEETLEVALQVCEALGEAHHGGTVHRDLKPSNLFLEVVPGREIFVKVLDFGIAKTVEAGVPDLTHSQALLASPAYASPEQLRASRDVDARSDLWSLGVVLYESLVGHLPFQGNTVAEISSQILRDPPRRPNLSRPDIPELLERVILRCLEKERDRRFESVEALVEALAPLAPAPAARCLAYVRGVSAAGSEPPAGPALEAAGPAGTLTHASLAARAPSVPPKKRRGPWALVAGFGAVALGAGAFFLTRSDPGEPEPADTESVTPTAVQAAPPIPSPPVHAPPPPPPPAPAPAPAATNKAVPRLASAAPPKPKAVAPRAAEKSRPSSARKPELRTQTPIEALPLNDLIDERR